MEIPKALSPFKGRLKSLKLKINFDELKKSQDFIRFLPLLAKLEKLDLNFSDDFVFRRFHG
jgi:hypothetical protein